MDTIKLNVSGKKYKIKKHVLNRYPQTRLARMTEKCKEYDRDNKEFFFDRNPKVMLSIFDLYRTGQLHLPENVCSFAIQNELKFWGIDEAMISECCWKKYRTSTRNTAVIDVIEKSLNSQPVITVLPTDSLRHRLWVIMDYPFYSISSRIWFTVYMLFVVATIFITILYTFPKLRVSISTNDNHQLATSLLDMLIKSEITRELYWLDIICLVFFTAEQLVKLAVCPDRKRFCRDYLNLMDLVLNVIMWTSIIVDSISAARNAQMFHFALRAAFSLNIFRIFHLGKYSRTVHMLIFTLKASRAALVLLLLSLIVTTLIYATSAYYAEVLTQADTFPNIPLAIWWTVITMTTVGYGDYNPSSWPGYVIGIMCSFTGILLIALPIVIVAANFDRYQRNIPAFEQRARYRELMKSDSFLFTDKQADTLQVNDMNDGSQFSGNYMEDGEFYAL